MRYAIFSDIHSNLEAFESVLAEYRRRSIDKYFCLGDIVGYGANPKECIEKVEKNNIETIAGNHDWAVGGKFDVKYFNPYAKEAVLWTQNRLESPEKEFLNKLKLLRKENNFVLVHGTLDKPGKFHYMLDGDAVAGTFQLMDCQLCFIGHTHGMEVFTNKNNKISYSSPTSIKIEEGIRYIINVGSIGQPRDRNPRASFCIYDSSKKRIEFLRSDYDIASAQNKIINNGLPSFLAQRLSEGV